MKWCAFQSKLTNNSKMKFKKKNNSFISSFILALIFVAVTLPSWTQTQADLLKNIWSDAHQTPKKRFEAFDNYYFLLIDQNPDQIIESSLLQLELAKKVSSKKQILIAMCDLSTAKLRIDKNKEALKVANDGYSLAKEYKDSVFMGHFLVTKGVIHRYEGNFKESFGCDFKALEIFEKVNAYTDQINLLSNIGQNFNIIEDYKRAVFFNKKALDLTIKLKKANKNGYMWLCHAQTYSNLKDYTNALKYNVKAFKIVSKSQDKMKLAYCHSIFSKIELAKGNNKKAIEHIIKSVDFAKKTKVNKEIIIYQTELASLLLNENVEKAKVLIEEVYSLIDEETSVELLVKIYDVLYRCYKKQNKLGLSLEMLEKYNIYNERLTKQKKDFDIIREVINREFADELRGSEIENAATINKLKRNQNIKVFSIVVVSIGLLLISFFYYRKRIISNNKERDQLLHKIESIKTRNSESNLIVSPSEFKLDREKIENTVNKKLNETDWRVLNIIYKEPVIANREIAEKAFLSVDGIGSSLRRMYELFNVKESKYKKISLIHEVVRISSNPIEKMV